MILVLIGLLTVVILLWWLLCWWFFEQLKPRFERWLWRKLGGSGEPPTT